MSRLSLSACCHLLSVDPKTLRQWLTQAQMELQCHPNDARIKCLEVEQVQVLAALHDRVLASPLEGQASEIPTAWTDEASSRMGMSDADLRARLAHVEAQVVTLQTQLTDLALQLRKRAAPSHEPADAGASGPTIHTG